MPRMAVIDIGSNSIRLVIYEYRVGAAFRTLEESKESARLSQRIGPDGMLSEADMAHVAHMLEHFKQLCHAQQATDIRPVATAAIRNARNASEIIAYLNRKTGLSIRLLTGEEEARYGFLGMANTLGIADGCLIDIGGGSTEITLFRDRKPLQSRSLPFGAVNTMKRFAPDGQYQPDIIQSIRNMVQEQLEQLPWTGDHPGLPLVGLGGTFRNLGKMHQRARQYSLSLMNGYVMSAEDVDAQLDRLLALPAVERREVDGLSKDRADIILPGMAILQTIYRRLGSDRYLVCSASLREGLLFETMFPDDGGLVADVFGFSTENLLAINPYASDGHARQVNRLALQLYDLLAPQAGLGARARKCLDAASLLYRIGVTIDYYRFSQHTFYMLSQANIFGLDHREILLTALIASFSSKRRTRLIAAKHPDLLDKSDLQLVTRMGSLLQLAVALDRSETQPIKHLQAQAGKKELILRPITRHHADIERRELAAVADDFKKEWRLKPIWEED